MSVSVMTINTTRRHRLDQLQDANDAALLARAGRGEDEAFAILVVRHRLLLLRIARAVAGVRYLRAVGIAVAALAFTVSLSGCMVISQSSREVIVTLDHRAWAEGPEAKAGTIRLFGFIDAATAADVSTKLAILAERADVERIRLLIACNGGEASSCRAIVNAIRAARHPVDGMVVGNCYSAAAAILQVTTGRRSAYANAHFMVHGPRVPESEDRGMADLTHFEAMYYTDIVRSRATLPPGWFPLSAEVLHFFTAEEALRYGFIDDIVSSPSPPAALPRPPRGELEH